IRDFHVTGVQTCALPISPPPAGGGHHPERRLHHPRAAPLAAGGRPDRRHVRGPSGGDGAGEGGPGRAPAPLHSRPGPVRAGPRTPPWPSAGRRNARRPARSTGNTPGVRLCPPVRGGLGPVPGGGPAALPLLRSVRLVLAALGRGLAACPGGGEARVAHGGRVRPWPRHW